MKVVTPPQRLKINVKAGFITPGGCMVIHYLIRRFFWFSAVFIYQTCHLENITSLFMSITVHCKPVGVTLPCV